MSTIWMTSTGHGVTYEIDGKPIEPNVFPARFLEPPPAIETLPKRERDRLIGYLQIRQENAARIVGDPEILLGATFEMHYDLQIAAREYGALDMPSRTAGSFVDAMIGELSALSGHAGVTVAGALHVWGKDKKPEDWRRIWTGE